MRFKCADDNGRIHMIIAPDENEAIARFKRKGIKGPVVIAEEVAMDIRKDPTTVTAPGGFKVSID
jgi:hypothetical protein